MTQLDRSRQDPSLRRAAVVGSGPGGLVVIPKGVPHSFRNFGDGPARLLGILMPGGLERMFETMNGRPASDFSQVAKEFSIEIVGPPLEPLA